MKQLVLVVDDEPRNQRIISLTLDGGPEIELAGSGEEALDKVSRRVPDLILLDIMMPGLDGYEVCRRMRQDSRLQRTRIILVSGKAMVEERLEGYQAGADDYMTKPFVPEELLAKVKVFLRLAQAERELDDLNRNLSQAVEERSRKLLDTEARMITSSKMAALGEMAAGIAHEINTPLGTIRLQAENLAKLLDAPTIDTAMLKKISAINTRTVDRIGAIVRSLRVFARDGTHDPLALHALDPILQTTFDLCREKIYQAGIEMRLPKPMPELQLMCNPVQLSQVFMNLIGNACDAVGELDSKWLEIKVELRGNRVRLTFTDSGPGITEAVYHKLFHPFFTTKEIGRGTGLGLSISRGIIETHQGTLDVDRTQPNTCFVIELARVTPE